MERTILETSSIDTSGSGFSLFAIRSDFFTKYKDSEINEGSSSFSFP
ncbi:hypothetical protein HRI96_11675 [Treponema parvum]|uniref:Uncharacterized protein n=1 Tax=Treponema parvum TaxID=138851 RepID=A0A975F1N9_9SPIR|nr:hypothetical protein HRI96_11675 [Treponema parvum]